jgi:hypothetical protein
MGIAKLSGKIGTVTGKRVFLPGLFFESREKHPFVSEEKRETPVDMEYAENEHDVVTYRVPEGFTFESAPADGKIPWTGHAAFQIKSTQDPQDQQRITVDRSLARAFTILASNEYAALRDFYQKVSTADQQQLVLTRVPETKGGSE